MSLWKRPPNRKKGIMMGAEIALAILRSPVAAAINQPSPVLAHAIHIQHATHVRNAPTSSLSPETMPCRVPSLNAKS